MNVTYTYQPTDWSYNLSTYSGNPEWLDRGYTGHEMLREFNLINMNARIYDPIIARMLQPDNYVQDATYTQNYNRYSYVLNNPTAFTDPSGDFIFTALAIITGQWWALPITIGADLGMWQGGSIANGTANPLEWDYSSGKTWAYMGAGAVVGGVSGYIGGQVATGGGFMANTSAIFSSSTINSMGTNIYTGGQTDVSVGFGFGSYNVSTGEFGYLGKKGNSAMENIGYGLGGLANVGDMLAGFNPGSVELRTENDPNYFKTIDANGNPIPQKDLIGHSQITNSKGTPLVDWGPTQGVNGFGDWVLGTNNYENGSAISASKMRWNTIKINGVNLDRISNWSPSGNYNLLFNSCVSQTSRALNVSGAFNIGIHPYILHAQMYLRSYGARPLLFSHFLIH